MENTKQKTFVQCKEIAQNVEFIKFADNFTLDIFLPESLNISFINSD